MKPSDAELLPCPFCGAEAAMSFCEEGCCGGLPRSVSCSKCHCEMPEPTSHTTFSDMAKAWNTRTPSQQPLPAGEGSSVPAELVRQWCRQWNDLPDPSPESRSIAEYVADKAAAYGREQAQWVPVSERLPPEHQGTCAVLMDDGSVLTAWPTYWHGSRNDFANWSFPVDPPDDQKVTHWMPLPEPPTC